MKNIDIDDIFRGFIIRHLNVIVIGFLVLCSMVIRFHLMKHGYSADYEAYFVPWLERYKSSIISGLREGVGDYYIPYNVLLALVSKLDVPPYIAIGILPCIFDYFTSILIYKILSVNFRGQFSRKTILAVSVAYLYIPSVVLNGATWKQCDAIYSFFVILLLKCLLDNRPRLAFLMFGVAFSFKLQAIFIAPLLIILYFLDKKIRISYIVYPIIAYILAGLPAVILGRPALDVYYSIYFGQAAAHHKMTLNYPNIYMIAMTDYEKLHIYTKLFTMFVFAMAFWYICSKLKNISGKTMLVLAMWIVWTCCMFLPAMHQRYDYLVAILLSICVPLVFREKAVLSSVGAALFYLGNIITYSYSLFGDDYNFIFVMCCNVIAYAMFSYILWYCLTKEESYGEKLNLDRQI